MLLELFLFSVSVIDQLFHASNFWALCHLMEDLPRLSPTPPSPSAQATLNHLSDVIDSQDRFECIFKPHAVTTTTTATATASSPPLPLTSAPLQIIEEEEEEEEALTEETTTLCDDCQMDYISPETLSFAQVNFGRLNLHA